MAFKVEKQGDGYVLGERLWLTADDKVVADGDPDAAFLLGGVGSTVSGADAERLGLTKRPPGRPAKQKE